MFYIFKYAGANPAYAETLCLELMDLQMRAVADIRPVLQEDTSPQSFDHKLTNAIRSLEGNTDFKTRQQRIISIQRQLDGQACPAPTLVQMTRLVVSST